MERLKVSYSMPVGRGRVRLLMRRPYRILDSRRFGLRMIGRLLALSAPCVFPLRLCASVCLRSVTKVVSKFIVSRLWLFSSDSRKCSTSKTSAEVAVVKVSELAIDDQFIRLFSDFNWRNSQSVLYTPGLLFFHFFFQVAWLFGLSLYWILITLMVTGRMVARTDRAWLPCCAARVSVLQCQVNIFNTESYKKASSIYSTAWSVQDLHHCSGWPKSDGLC